ncbi:unnamed protein product [Arabidopsis arenosa]|uniref:Protein kinase domain-containing protein n=1 Tax=Arabidopsis arenosa TaxID=38785 RepID=A0A8S2B5W4_ARAAE|nr:unnamed protein product [Arabidopsis arenosa]
MFLLVSLLFVSRVTSRNFTIENKCDYTVWPGVLTTNTVPLSTTGFELKKGEARVINAPSSWTGRFWGRSLCSTSSKGNFSCATGDCGSGKIECSEGSAPPTTLAEFSLNGSNGQDFYDVSLVDGYNLPLVVVPQRPQSGQTCVSIGCVVNLTKTCPSELQVMGSSSEGEPIACMNACQKFKTAEFCCTGEYSTPQKCPPSLYAKNFKNECPLAYSYVYDDATSTFTCSNSPNYVITFCPPITSNTTNNNRSSAADPPFPAQPSKETNGGTKRISRGLEYLHNRCVTRIVHFDIKPQNILMDDHLCPKISDFGLAKLCKNKEVSIISMLDARGTAGYIAPEVFSKNFGGASHKSDVYSYGMVILEMIGARNINMVKNARSTNSSVYFPDWIYKDFEQGEIMRILGDQITEEEEKIAKKMVLVGLWCIQTNPSDRPPMIKVIEMLEGNLEALEIPPKPLLYLPAATVPETLEDSNETTSFSNPTQFERGTPSAS